MGQVTARKRGKTWEYRFEAAPINGKRIQHSKGGFQTKKEAIDAGTLAKAEYDRTGIAFKPSEMSYSDYLDKWIKEYGEFELDADTIYGYKKLIRLHIKPELGKYKLNTLVHEILQNFIKKKFDEGFSRNTLSVMKSIINGSLNYAVFPLKYIAFNPGANVKLPSKNSIPNTPTRGKKRVIIPDEVIKLIFNRFPERSSAHIPLCFGYYCGMRQGECFAVDLDKDIDFENKILHLRHQLQFINNFWTIKPPKYNSIRDIDLNNKMIQLLLNEKERQNKNRENYGEYYKQLKVNEKGQLNYVEGKNIRLATMRENGEFLSPRILQHVGRVIHYEKGIEYKDYDFHSLRYKHTTFLLGNGADLKYVQMRLGHKSIKVTLEIYYKLTDEIRENNKKFIEML